MQYLRIASPGVADPMALTVMGVGTSRYSGRSDVIGQFASGSKLAAGLLLRNNIAPVIITGNLRLQYGIKPIIVDGQDFNQVQVTYSGTDIEGKSRTSTETLGYTLEWGVADWNDLTMAPREYVANAIDAVYKQDLTPDAIEVGLTGGIRAKKGWTQVYIPANEEILRFYAELNVRFLHFGRKELLGRKLLPKIVPDEAKIRVYKKGVLVAEIGRPSVWDYNLGDELRLDESRNAQFWDVKDAIAKALAHADAGALAVVIKQVATAGKDGKLLETELPSGDLSDRYSPGFDARKKNWQDALVMVGGPEAVASAGMTGVDSHLIHKGKKPVVLPENWVNALNYYEAPVDTKVLSESEMTGEVLWEPTTDMQTALDDVWNLLVSFEMTNGKEKPPVMGFVQNMVAGSQKRGEYRNGTVLIHNDIGAMSPILRKVMLEEVVHHVTGAGDMSRDLQDFMFRLAVVMAW